MPRPHTLLGVFGEALDVPIGVAHNGVPVALHVVGWLDAYVLLKKERKKEKKRKETFLT